MGLLNIFNKKGVKSIKETEEEQFNNYIKSLNLKNIKLPKLEYLDSEREYSGSGRRIETIKGPFKSQFADGRIIIPTLNESALYGFAGALEWVTYENNTKSFIEWYKTELYNFISNICILDKDEVKYVTDKVMHKDLMLGAKAVKSLSDKVVGDKESLYDFFYTCLAIDLIKGKVYDYYKICKELYNKDRCRNLVNNFPIKACAVSADTKYLNIAIAFWITYTASNSNSTGIGYAKTTLYYSLLDYLGYNIDKVISKEDAITYSGIDKRLIDVTYGSILKDMCKSNININRFINMLNYILCNEIDYIELNRTFNNSWKFIINIDTCDIDNNIVNN